MVGIVGYTPLALVIIAWGFSAYQLLVDKDGDVTFNKAVT